MTTPAGRSRWSDGAATGLGSMPGTSIDEAARIVAGELPELPFVPELPAGGVGADQVGRTVALLVDITGEVVPSGWRISRRPGIDHRRADDHRRRELDAAEQFYAGAEWIKVQVLGPWSLAAGLEVPSGNRALIDRGAVDDLAASLLEGLRRHLAELTSRTGAAVVVQVDEPALSGVIAGTLSTASGFGTVRAIDPIRAGDLLGDLVTGLGTPAIANTGGAEPALLRAAGFAGLVVDLTTLGTRAAALDPLGEAVEAGVVLLAGLLRPGADRLSLRDRVAPLLETWQHWGFPLSLLPGAVVPTPTRGLAGRTVEEATTLLRLAAEIARALPDPPDDW